MSKCTGAFRSKTAEMFAALLWGPQTPRTLARGCDISVNPAHGWLRTLLNAGVVRIVGRWKIDLERAGHWGQIYELQSTPFALPDDHTTRWVGDPPRRITGEAP